MAAVFDRIKGALYGVAVGDALGGPLEFMPREAVRRAYPEGLREMVGGGWLNLRPGETTDDTAMTLCVANGILDAELLTSSDRADEGELADAIGNRFIAWVDTNPPDIGNTCRSAIARARHNLDAYGPFCAWHDAAESLGENQDGNGALMRCIYPGLWYRSAGHAGYVAARQSHLTHSGLESETACRRYSMLVSAYVSSKVTRRYERRLLELIPCNDCGSVSEVPADWSPSGYVVDTLHAVMLAMQEPTFEGTLIKAVNFGGDADTVGAIAGGLAGAKYGFKAIPKRWVAALDPALHSELDKLAKLAYSNRK